MIFFGAACGSRSWPAIYAESTCGRSGRFARRDRVHRLRAMAGINSSWPSSASYIRRAHRHVYDQSVFVSCVKSFAAADAVLTFELLAAAHEARSATHCRDERAPLEVFLMSRSSQSIIQSVHCEKCLYNMILPPSWG